MASVSFDASAADIALDARTASTVHWSFEVLELVKGVEAAGWLIVDMTRAVEGQTASGHAFTAPFSGTQAKPVSWVAARSTSMQARPGAADDHALVVAAMDEAIAAVTEGIGMPRSTGGGTDDRYEREARWSFDGADFVLRVRRPPTSILAVELWPS